MVNKDRSRLKSEGALRCCQERSLLMPALLRKARHLWPLGDDHAVGRFRAERLGGSTDANKPRPLTVKKNPRQGEG